MRGTTAGPRAGRAERNVDNNNRNVVKDHRQLVKEKRRMNNDYGRIVTDERRTVKHKRRVDDDQWRADDHSPRIVKENGRSLYDPRRVDNDNNNQSDAQRNNVESPWNMPSPRLWHEWNWRGVQRQEMIIEEEEEEEEDDLGDEEMARLMESWTQTDDDDEEDKEEYGLGHRSPSTITLFSGADEAKFTITSDEREIFQEGREAEEGRCQRAEVKRETKKRRDAVVAERKTRSGRAQGRRGNKAKKEPMNDNHAEARYFPLSPALLY